jgi:hypothetical protein
MVLEIALVLDNGPLTPNGVRFLVFNFVLLILSGHEHICFDFHLWVPEVAMNIGCDFFSTVGDRQLNAL